MGDLWAFLLQTLTATGAAALLLLLKALFRDKLSPRWQFGIWAVLALVLLFPAGLGGRWSLVPWPLLVEALKTLCTGDVALTRIYGPLPLPPGHMPQNPADWLFLIYFAGVLAMAGRYLWTYFCLRQALNHGSPLTGEQETELEETAARYGLKPCKAIQVPGLRSAFVCGLLHPVLALPEGELPDEKILLHELLHLHHHDILLNLMIALFRSIHWCNPLLWYCADLAGNDLEALCDQRVLEHLEGEERRDYGRILLSMASETYARTPGTSSIANGGRNIRMRIEAIARFKRYPAGMSLVSVCMAVLLCLPLTLGTQEQTLWQEELLPPSAETVMTLASARLMPCTTYAGAVDSYGKALLLDSIPARILSADDAERERLARCYQEGTTGLAETDPRLKLPGEADLTQGYFLYDLERKSPDRYEGLLLLPLANPNEEELQQSFPAAYQKIAILREGRRWITEPLTEFIPLTTLARSLLWGCPDLPGNVVYSDTAGELRVDLHFQTSYSVDNSIPAEPSFLPMMQTFAYDWALKPDARFDQVYLTQSMTITHTGSPETRKSIRQLGITVAPYEEDGTRPLLEDHGLDSAQTNFGGSSSSLELWENQILREDWGPTLENPGGGTGRSPEEYDFTPPERFAADLYLNGRKADELTLTRQEVHP